MPVTKTCLICNVEFKVPPARAETATTCGRACKGVLLRQRYEAAWLTTTCPACGTEYKHPEWQRFRVYCSETCKWSAESSEWADVEKSEGGTVSRKKDGYVIEYRPRHPFAVRGWLMQHRLVMEQWMREQSFSHEFLIEHDGEKYLRSGIEVHHRDEVKHNNERENLVACTRFGHRAMHYGKPVKRGDAWPLNGLIVEGMAVTSTFQPLSNIIH